MSILEKAYVGFDVGLTLGNTWAQTLNPTFLPISVRNTELALVQSSIDNKETRTTKLWWVNEEITSNKHLQSGAKFLVF